MYPSITPEVRAESTISNPLDDIEVVGYEGRNTRFGTDSIVMKSPKLGTDYQGNVALIPESHARNITVNGSELIVLKEGTVYAITPTDFEKLSYPADVRGEQRAADVMVIDLDSYQVAQFDRKNVEVSL